MRTRARRAVCRRRHLLLRCRWGGGSRAIGRTRGSNYDATKGRAEFSAAFAASTSNRRGGSPARASIEIIREIIGEIIRAIIRGRPPYDACARGASTKSSGWPMQRFLKAQVAPNGLGQTSKRPRKVATPSTGRELEGRNSAAEAKTAKGRYLLFGSAFAAYDPV